MILALTGQFKQLSLEPEKFRWLTGFEPMTSAMPVQCSNQLSYEVTQLRAGQYVGLMFSRERNVVWKKCYMKCGVLNQLKTWSSHLLDNLSNCLLNLKNSGDSTGFEPMTSAMPVQCSNQLSYEVTQLRAGQYIGLMFSRERNVVWKKCYMKCGVLNQLKTWSSHLLDNLSNCLLNLKNSGDSVRWLSQVTQSPEFFRFKRQLLKLSSKCEARVFSWFKTPHFI